MSETSIKQKFPRGQPGARFAYASESEVPRRSAEDVVHELQERLIEFKIQNQELQREIVALKESRDRYGDLCEFAPVGYLMLSRTAVVEKANLTATLLLGVEYKNLLRRRFDHFVSPERLDDWYSHFAGVVRHDARQSMELELKRVDGSVFHARLDFLGMTTYERSPVMRLALTDITQRKLVEQESMALLRRNQMLMKTSLDGFHIMDIQGNVLEANDAFSQMLGYSQEEMTNLNIADFEAQWTSAELAVIFREAIGKSYVFESLLRRKDGTLVNVELSTSNVNIGGQHYFFASARDITERKRLENELINSEKQLHELLAKQALMLEEERKSIAREVHDELGQMLTTLHMDISVLRIRFGKRNRELMSMVQKMTELINRAIYGVRNVAENLRPVALDIGIVSAIEWLCKDFTEHTGIPCLLHTSGERVELDEARVTALFRIVQESLTNVARHAEARKVEVRQSLENGNLYLEVADDGKGFNQGGQAMKQKSYGLLGMRERALSLGGEVRISSAVGEGTLISVRIPLDPGVLTK